MSEPPRADVSPPASPAVRAEWRRRVEAEYRSAAHATGASLTAVKALPS